MKKHKIKRFSEFSENEKNLAKSNIMIGIDLSKIEVGIDLTKNPIKKYYL